MTTFAVIPLSESALDLQKALEGIQTVYRDYEPNVLFVQYGGTAKQLAERVGFSQQHGAKNGIVVEVVDYYGYANTNLWRWLERS